MFSFWCCNLVVVIFGFVNTSQVIGIGRLHFAPVTLLAGKIVAELIQCVTYVDVAVLLRISVCT